jgi:hypothetical protein
VLLRRNHEDVAPVAGHAPRERRPAGPGPAVEQWAAARRPWLDNLKVGLIAAIIAIHAVMSYASMELWSYTELRETTLTPVVEAVTAVLVAPFGFFVITVLFLAAGLLTPPSLERKGPGRFVRDRLLHLGVPFGIYVLVVQPVVMYAVEHTFGDASRGFWYEYLGTEKQLDTGPLWFVGVLLIFSLGYAGWVAQPHRHAAWRAPRRTNMRQLLLVTLAVAAASFAIRIVYPYGGDSGFTDLNFWQWPASVAAFGLGISGSRQGWGSGVPAGLADPCRTVTLMAAAAMAVLLTIAGFRDRVDPLMGGWGWPALVFAAVEAALTIFGSVWLLAVAQRRLDRRIRWGPVLSRSSYAAFILQTPVLLGLAVALRPVALPAEIKALLLAAAGVATCFALAWWLVSRVRVLARVL